MRSVGLTHGGFYGHFASKEELMALACRRAVADMLADWRARAAAAPGDPAATIVAPYLAAGHRDAPGGGCLMAALGPEAARAAPPVREAVTECLGDVLDTIAGEMPGARPAGAPARRRDPPVRQPRRRDGRGPRRRRSGALRRDPRPPRRARPSLTPR